MKEKYTTIEGIQKKASRLVYGTGTPYFFENDPEKAHACLDRAWEAGFRTFDTAHTYGCSEELIGSWLSLRGVREEMVLIDKGCDPGQKGHVEELSAQTILDQVQESLDKLQTNYFDFYLLHRDDESRPVDEVVETLNQLKSDGIVTRFGVSNWRKHRILEANRYAASHGLDGFSAFSPSFSLADLAQDLFGGSVTISGDENKDIRGWLEETQLPVFNYSSLARGYLSGKYNPASGKPIEECLNPISIAEYDSPRNRVRLQRAFELAEQKNCSATQICLAWVLNQKMNLFPIVSPGSTEHMQENMDILQMDLTEEEMKYLEA